MKYVILLALVALAAAQHDHVGDPLHQLVHDEVAQIVQDNPGISLDDCISKCDALFDLAAGHDEEMTDNMCKGECEHALHQHGHPPHQNN